MSPGGLEALLSPFGFSAMLARRAGGDAQTRFKYQPVNRRARPFGRQSRGATRDNTIERATYFAMTRSLLCLPDRRCLALNRRCRSRHGRPRPSGGRPICGRPRRSPSIPGNRDCVRHRLASKPAAPAKGMEPLRRPKPARANRSAPHWRRPKYLRGCL